MQSPALPSFLCWSGNVLRESGRLLNFGPFSTARCPMSAFGLFQCYCQVQQLRVCRLHYGHTSQLTCAMLPTKTRSSSELRQRYERQR
jgi:hypothetical protein